MMVQQPWPFRRQLSGWQKYSCPLNNAGVRSADPPHSQKSVFNFRLPQNLITNNLLLPGSLTGNLSSQLTHMLYVTCITLYSCNKVSQRKENIRKIIRNRKYIRILYAFMTYLTLNFFKFLCYMIPLQFLSNCHKSSKTF